MTKRLFSTLITLTSIGACSVAVAATPADISNRLLEQLHKVSGAPGMAAAVVQDGELIWTGTAGMADLDAELPVTEDTQFRLASVSKLYTAVLALRLIENGSLDPDADIRNYVPQWPEDRDTVITPRQLAAHTSGIGHYGAADILVRSRNHRYATAAEAVEVYSHRALNAAPGSQYFYSSYGFALLSAAIEGASKQDYRTALRRLLLEPHGLEQTIPEQLADIPSEASRLYDDRANRLERYDQSYALGATGILGSAGDVARFGAAFASGRIVEPKTVDMGLTAAQLNDGNAVDAGRYRMGFGWRLGSGWDGRRIAHHAGVTPGARSVLLIYPDTGTAVSLLSNASWTSRIETAAELLAEPFRGEQSSPCPAGSWSMQGSFDGQPESATIKIFEQSGLCVGTLVSGGALAERFDSHGEAPGLFPMMRIRGDHAENVFALAYPWGLAPISLGNSELKGDFAGRLMILRR